MRCALVSPPGEAKQATWTSALRRNFDRCTGCVSLQSSPTELLKEVTCHFRVIAKTWFWNVYTRFWSPLHFLRRNWLMQYSTGSGLCWSAGACHSRKNMDCCKVLVVKAYFARKVCSVFSALALHSTRNSGKRSPGLCDCVTSSRRRRCFVSWTGLGEMEVARELPRPSQQDTHSVVESLNYCSLFLGGYLLCRDGGHCSSWKMRHGWTRAYTRLAFMVLGIGGIGGISVAPASALCENYGV